ncbi:MAG TPA: FAD/NAD(P)-binding oxidoreductase [Bacteriovoracaceae bacterium]|nr:FAD/NAD(P)-binding oxidoreductase [Bacteriovoracaceae bacterium]
MSQKHFKLLILGAGSGGISVAARMKSKINPTDIAIIDPSDTHYYQPLWTLAGAGVIKKEKSFKLQKDLIPKGVQWIQRSVVDIDPSQKKVSLKDGTSVGYDFLVVALGLRLAWEKIKGLDGHLGKNGICSIYEYNQVDSTSAMLNEFKGGRAIFTMPPVPIKCAGAPQKIMYLADDIFRKNGVREKSTVNFATAGKVMFGIPVFSKALDEVVKRRAIETMFQHKLTAVDAALKTATFEVTDAQGVVSENLIKFDLLHVVPPMTAPTIIINGPLSAKEGDQKGWLSVNKFSLQHTVFTDIFGIGDVTGVPNSKTGAAVRMQAPVVVKNLLDAMAGKPLSGSYNGYSSCPLITGFGKVILAEFGYDGKLMPSFPIDATKERKSMWHLKKDLLPTLYWKAMLKGRL